FVRGPHRHRSFATSTPTTTGSRDRTCACSMGMRMIVAVVALLQPATEPGGVGMDAVERLELLPVLGVDARELGAEGGVERLGDVAGGAKGRLRHLGPRAQDLSGFDERDHRIG